MDLKASSINSEVNSKEIIPDFLVKPKITSCSKPSTSILIPEIKYRESRQFEHAKFNSLS